MKTILRALASGAFLLFGSAASAQPVSYSFAGTVLAGATEFIGQSLYGTITYDVGLSTQTGTCCTIGTVAQSEQAQTAPGAASYASAFVTLSGGSSFATGNGLLYNYGYSEVIKLAGEEGSPGPLNVFTLDSRSQDSDSVSRTILLQASDSLGTSSTLFPDLNAGLANNQPVNWLAPGADAYGFIYLQSGSTSELVAQFTLERVSVVPELSLSTLLVAGLLALVAVRERRFLWRKRFVPTSGRQA